MECSQLRRSYFIRCVQQDKNNAQHAYAEGLKTLLSSAEAIQSIIPTAENERAAILSKKSVSFAERYELVTKEEEELINEESTDTSVMNCYLKTGKSGKLRVLYEHVAPSAKPLKLMIPADMKQGQRTTQLLTHSETITPEKKQRFLTLVKVSLARVNISYSCQRHGKN